MANVWEILSDHSALPQWRIDCQAVSILSTHHVGQGVRRRISPKRGTDFLEDFKAWYNGFGYEYQIVDSKTYKYNLSRLRLQATPDGTIVQWTIEYDIKGSWSQFLGGRRHRYLLEKTVIDSLRELRRYVVAKGIPLDDIYRTKAGVQDAPDVQKRATYGAQLFSQVEATEQVEDATGSNKAVTVSAEKSATITEPPVRIDDTPSIPIAPPPSFITSQFDVKTPVIDASDDTNEPAKKVEISSDTQPSAPIQLEVEPKPDKPEISDTPPVEPSTVISVPATMQQPPPASDSMAKSPTPAPVMMSAPDTNEEKPVVVIDKRFMEDSRAKTKPKPPEGLAEAIAQDEPPKQDRDTDQMSIWDVFGVARPAELETASTSEPSKLAAGKAKVPAQMSAPPTPKSDKLVDTENSTATVPEPAKPAQTKKSPSLDEILAMEEPPLPVSASSSSVKTIVRSSSQSQKTIGLRKKQSRKTAPVRTISTSQKADKGG